MQYLINELSAKIINNIWRFKMNGILTNSNKWFLISRILLLILLGLGASIKKGQAKTTQDSPASLDNLTTSSSHRSAKQSLIHRTIRERLDFGLSDGKGNGYGLPESIMSDENEAKGIPIHRLDFALSDGQGNGNGLPKKHMQPEINLHTLNINRLDFALSDGRGNGLGYPDGSDKLIINAMAAICP